MAIASSAYLPRIARAIHDAAAGHVAAQLIYVEVASADDITIGTWDIPQVLDHPIDPLVGFRAPDAWDAIGITCGGRLRSLAEDDPWPIDAHTTALLHRDGTVASVLGRTGEPPQVLAEPPVGWVPDVLARILGRPTPPPEHSTAAFIDLVWLDRVAAGLLGRPSVVTSWRWLADRHPLRGAGEVPDPSELQARTFTEAERAPWSRLRAQASLTTLPAASFGPPGGTFPDGSEWFDDGSMSRWLVRQLPPAEVLLPDLLSVLPPGLGEDLLRSLVECDHLVV